MKKIPEMNGNERIAWKNIKGVFDWEIGGWYNCIQDECPEHIPSTYEEAFSLIYEQVMNNTAGNGHFRIGKAPKEMRFAGTEFIKECIEFLFKKDEDAQEIAEVKGWNV